MKYVEKVGYARAHTPGTRRSRAIVETTKTTSREALSSRCRSQPRKENDVKNISRDYY